MGNERRCALNLAERHLARNQFKVRVYSASGQGFESLFTDVMSNAVAGFRQVKPQGAIGDRGNDGYVAAEGRYWQVYAPEDPSDKGGAAAKKALENFKTLKAYWDRISPIRAFYFAMNDHYRGSYPELELVLSQMKSEYGLAVCEVFLAKDLEDAFMGLDDDRIIAVVGPIPSVDDLRAELTYDALSEVIDHLMRDLTPLEADGNLNIPDWEHKIRFNRLSGQVAGLLQGGACQVGSLERYFRSNSRWARLAVRERLEAVYATAKENLGWKPGEDEESGDTLFFMVLNGLVPREERAVRNAALVLMSYFFEMCDIFEEPR